MDLLLALFILLVAVAVFGGIFVSKWLFIILVVCIVVILLRNRG